MRRLELKRFQLVDLALRWFRGLLAVSPCLARLAGLVRLILFLGRSCGVQFWELAGIWICCHQLGDGCEEDRAAKSQPICVDGRWKIFYFHPYLGKWSNLTNIFQLGWNHQLENEDYCVFFCEVLILSHWVLSLEWCMMFQKRLHPGSLRNSPWQVTVSKE